MARAVRKTPQEATAKWVEKLSAAGPEIEAGVKRVQESPGVAAARQSAKYEARVRESFAKWKQRVAGLNLADWQNSMINVGVQRVASGAQAKQHKMAAFAAEFYPFMDQVLARINAMPTTTPQQRIAKMVANAEAIRQFKRTGTGGGMAA